MKLVRNLAATLLLTCVLAVNVLAGDQQTPAFCQDPSCPPPPCTTDCESTATSDAEKSVESPADESDYLFETLMALLSVY